MKTKILIMVEMESEEYVPIEEISKDLEMEISSCYHNFEVIGIETIKEEYQRSGAC